MQRIQKVCGEKMLCFDDYKKCLFNPVDGKSIYSLQLVFRNRKHAVEVNKVALSRDDDKQVVQRNSVHGHYSLSQEFTLIRLMRNDVSFQEKPFYPGIENAQKSQFPESVILSWVLDFQKVSFCSRISHFAPDSAILYLSLHKISRYHF